MQKGRGEQAEDPGLASYSGVRHAAAAERHGRPALSLAKIATGCCKLYRARSRLYRNEILQENMRLKALAEIYTLHSFALL